MKNRKIIIALLLVAIVGIVGLTFAYFSNATTMENEFNSKEYGNIYTEEFVSPDGWLPGDITEKIVVATNTGEVDQAVRIRVSEAWTTEHDGTLNGWIHADGTKSTHTSENELATDERVAILNLANTSDWTKVGDYYYYNYKLAPTESTTSFLESVTFNPKTKLDDTCTTSTNNGVTTTTCNSSGDDYDDATYTLTLTIETVQYDKYDDAWDLDDTVTIAEERLDPTETDNYAVTTSSMVIGQSLPNGVTLKSASLAKADWVDIAGSEQPIYLKATLNGSDEIEELNTCFEKNGTQYCLSSEGSDSTFRANATIIYDAFEGQGCMIDNTNMTDPYSASYIPNPSYEFSCSAGGLDVTVYKEYGGYYALTKFELNNNTAQCDASSVGTYNSARCAYISSGGASVG